MKNASSAPEISKTLATLLPDYQLNASAVEYIKRSALPSTVPNGRFSYTVHYPCKLTNEVIVMQSRDFEFACLLTILGDPQTGYIMPQPPTLEVEHVRTKYYSPDFLVFYKDGRRPTLIETRPLSQLADRVVRHPDRYVSPEPNTFDMPLVRKKAEEMGFDLRVIHEGYFTEKFVNNIRLLEPYRKLNLNPAPTDEEKKAIKDQVLAKPGIKFADVVHKSSDRNRADLIHHMLAEGEIFAHLSDESLKDQNRVGLFATRVRERALAIFHAKNPPSSTAVCPYILFDGLQYTMKGKRYTITQSTGPVITIVNPRNQSSQIPMETFLSMFPEIDAFHGAELIKEERLNNLSDKELAEILRRWDLVRPYVSYEEGKKPRGPKERAVQRYLAAYRKEQENSQNGFLGLIPRFSDRGSTESTFSPRVVQLMGSTIMKHYCRAHPRLTILEVHGRFSKLMQRLKLGAVPSYRTFAKECEKLGEEVTLHKRWGSRMAKLALVPSAARSPLGAPQGERPFSVCHCDSTVNDLALDHPDSLKRLLKPVHTPMVDATTQRVVAYVTRLEAPSTDTIIALLRDCVRRNHTLPTILVVDGARDHRSTWLQETATQHLHMTILYRQVATAMSGSAVENKFLLNDVRLIHCLKGSTEALKRCRLTTGSMLPYKRAIWTLKDLQEQYDDHYEVFNNTPYGHAKQSPNEREAELCRIYGKHPRAVIPMPLLERVLLPFVDRIYRTVDRRCRIFVGRTYYASDALDCVKGKRVSVRHRPGDPRTMIVSHPDLPGPIECDAVSSDVKYADSAASASEVVLLKNLSVPEVKSRKAANWQAAAERRSIKEKGLDRRKREASKAPASDPSVAPPPAPPPASPSNVVPFYRSQGGLRNLLVHGGVR